MMARTPGAVQGIMFLLVLPLSFGSNTFVQTGTMPGWLQGFVKVNPITHLVDAVRRLDAGRPGGLARAVDTRLDGRAARRVRPARDARLPASHLIPTRIGQVDRLRAACRPTGRPLLLESVGAQHLPGAGGDPRDHQVGRVIRPADARSQS